MRLKRGQSRSGGWPRARRSRTGSDGFARRLDHVAKPDGSAGHQPGAGTRSRRAGAVRRQRRFHDETRTVPGLTDPIRYGVEVIRSPLVVARMLHSTGPERIACSMLSVFPSEAVRHPSLLGPARAAEALAAVRAAALPRRRLRSRRACSVVTGVISGTAVGHQQGAMGRGRHRPRGRR